MKLLIDIPEHIYEHAKEESEDSRDEGEAMRAIANGSPLSKGHGDLIAEKERLIKKDIASIENKVRHVFNQGYEMGVKAYKENMSSRSEIPNTCEDAISRDAAIRAIEALQRPIMREESNYYQFKFSGMSEAREAVENLPSVTPKQKIGRWIQKEEEGEAEPFIIWECSECHCVDEDGKPSYKYCPQCGAKMEVEG